MWEKPNYSTLFEGKFYTVRSKKFIESSVYENGKFWNRIFKYEIKNVEWVCLI